MIYVVQLVLALGISEPIEQAEQLRAELSKTATYVQELETHWAEFQQAQQLNELSRYIHPNQKSPQIQILKDLVKEARRTLKKGCTKAGAQKVTVCRRKIARKKLRLQRIELRAKSIVKRTKLDKQWARKAQKRKDSIDKKVSRSRDICKNKPIISCKKYISNRYSDIRMYGKWLNSTYPTLTVKKLDSKLERLIDGIKQIDQSFSMLTVSPKPLSVPCSPTKIPASTLFFYKSKTLPTCAQIKPCNKSPSLDVVNGAWRFSCEKQIPSPVDYELVRVAYDGMTFVVMGKKAKRKAQRIQTMLLQEGYNQLLRPVPGNIDKRPVVNIVYKTSLGLVDINGKLISSDLTAGSLRQVCRMDIRVGNSGFRPNTAMVFVTASAKKLSLNNPCFNSAWNPGQIKTDVDGVVLKQNLEVRRMLNSIKRRLFRLDELYLSNSVCSESLSQQNTRLGLMIPKKEEKKCHITLSTLGLDSTQSIQKIVTEKLKLKWSDTAIDRKQLVELLNSAPQGGVSVQQVSGLVQRKPIK